MIRVSFTSLLVSFAWTSTAHAQNSVGLDFTVATVDRSPPSSAVVPLTKETTNARIDSVRTVVPTAIDTNPEANRCNNCGQDTIALSFDVPDAQSVAPVPRLTSTVQALAPRAVASAAIFIGGSDSLIARVVGHAEGTRTANGSKTRAYYGHSDPGNSAWNLGSFSYQHAAQSPEEADEKQLQRLQAQAEIIRQRAALHRLTLSLEEELNALDLANQSPLAALATPGYVEWLKQAHDRGLSGLEAVLWARTRSYWDVQRNRWDAPGLGNSEGHITYDQNRRLTAIARALTVYQQQQKPSQEQIADRIVFQDLSQLRPGVAVHAKN